MNVKYAAPISFVRSSLIRLIAVTTVIASLSRASANEPSFAEFDRRAKDGEHLNVVFFGASLTWGANASDPQLTSYRARIGQRLEKKYPKAHFKCWDAAIGGTDSRLGVFRLERDVLRRKPDLVFLDFSANDDISSADEEKLSSYESLVRRILRDAKAPIVQVVFPFQWNVAQGNTDGMPRRLAHQAIAEAYHTAFGDAIALAEQRVHDHQTTLAEIWPLDGVHPCDKGYELFADAAWDAFQVAVAKGVDCKSPEKMLHSTTYMTSVRASVASLSPLPAGWRIAKPSVTSAYFDMLMSRWLDDEAVASNNSTDGNRRVQPSELRARFQGSMAMLFGESTPKSGKYQAFVDGKVVRHKAADGKMIDQFDAADFAHRINGNAYLVQVLAEGLDSQTTHELRIEPNFADGVDQELRLESICVAGGKAEVTLMVTKSP